MTLPKHYIAIAWSHGTGFFCACGKDFKTREQYDAHLGERTLFG